MCDSSGKFSILSIIQNIENLISKEYQKLLAPIIATNMVKNVIKTSTNSSNGGYTRENIRFAENLPTEGEPNSTKDLLNPDGTIKKKRYYGPNGKAIKDTDYSHPGKHEFPHNHDWEWDGDNCKRGPAYNLRNLGKGIGIGVGGYVLYRGFRMIPSLFPALWWTIPANVATP